MAWCYGGINSLEKKACYAGHGGQSCCLDSLSRLSRRGLEPRSASGEGLLKNVEEQSARAVRQLAVFPPELRASLVELARRHSPSAVGRHAQMCVTLAGCSGAMLLLAAEKGTRWLAVILRDHGEAAFAQAVAAVLGNAAPHQPQWRLGSGEAVINSPRNHVASHSSVLALLPDALSRVASRGRDVIADEIDFGRPIGESICVRTTTADTIVFAQRPRRLGLTRFVCGRTPEPCSGVVVVLRKEVTGEYQLATAYIGRRAEPEPWDRYATPNSVAFWNTHALIWGAEQTISGTETTQCPW